MRSLRPTRFLLLSGLLLVALSGNANASDGAGVLAFAGAPVGCRCQSHIYTVSPDGSGLTQISTTAPVTADPFFTPAFVWGPSISATGSTLLFEGRYGFFTMTPGASPLEVASGGPHGPVLTGSVLSPDGSTVLGMDQTDRFLFTVPSTGGPTTPIRGTSHFRSPAFSPDGKHLVAVRQQWRPIRTQVYIMDLDGSHRRIVPHTRYLSEPSFSPDGKWIIGSKAVSVPPVGSHKWVAWGVFMVRTNGTGWHRVGHVSSVAQAPEPVISPDGSKVALTRYRMPGLRSQIMVMNIDGSDLRRISTPGLAPSHPSWGSFAQASRAP